jgi:hypothetical protein
MDRAIESKTDFKFSGFASASILGQDFQKRRESGHRRGDHAVEGLAVSHGIHERIDAGLTAMALT